MKGRILSNHTGESNLLHRQITQKLDKISKQSCAELIVSTLEELGIERAFGLPGGAIANIFAALSLSKKIQIGVCQHEGGAAYMAMGVGLHSKGKQIGVCFATSGPGITNLITGVAAAYEERIPILVITGNVSTSFMGKGAAQDAYPGGVDAVKMLEPVTVESVTVLNAEDVVPTLKGLFRKMQDSRLPGHINIPVNIAGQLISKDPEKFSELFFDDNTKPVGLTAAEHSFSSFISSPRPLIFAGNGIKSSGLEKQLVQFVEKFDLPIVVSSHAKGIVPENHQQYLGCFGFAAPPETTDRIQAYKPTAILFLGTRLGELSTAGWSQILSEPEIRVHVDKDGGQLNKVYSVTHPVCCYLEDFFNFTFSYQNVKSKKIKELCENLLQIKSSQESNSHVESSTTQFVNPIELVYYLNKTLPDNAVVFSDIGNSMAWLIRDFRVKGGQDLYIPLGFGSMGSGLCSAIGAKSIEPDRPVIAVSGDCSVLMHGTEMFTAKNLELGIKVLVLNDGGHGMVDHGHRFLNLPSREVRFQKKVDFAKFAESLNIQSFRAQSLAELQALPLQDLLCSPEPLLIDILIDDKATPPIATRTRVLGQSA